VVGSEAAVTVAFAHLLFNVFGIALIWPMRRVPIAAAVTLARWSVKSRLIPLAYILTVFFLIPILLIYLTG
jgi:sodium-dependent phosphate cotransporter